MHPFFTRSLTLLAMVLCIGFLHSVMGQTTPAAFTTDANTPAERRRAFVVCVPSSCSGRPVGKTIGLAV